jgi:deoxycytidylate deaminase/dephospho-CoA kinase
MDSRIVIGLTGPFGAGCSTIAEDLSKRRKWRGYSLSQAMREIAPNLLDSVDKKKLVSPGFRSYQQDVGDQIRRKDPYAIPAKVVEKISDDQERHKSFASLNIVIDGIRNPSEIVYLQDTFVHFFVVAVFAPFQIRWDRKKADYKGDLGKFERDDARDSGEFESPWGQKVQLCVDRSDILISNELQFEPPRTRRAFQDKVDSYIELMETPGSRVPYSWELNMAQAYEASLRSTCCKRKVGAVIVKEEFTEKESRSYVVATGYNEAPLNIASCVDRGGKGSPEYCYKDDKAGRVLKKEYKYCPQCGKKLKFPEEFDVPFICPNCDARLGRDFIPGRMLDLCVALHAEEAAVLQASKFGGTQIDGSTLYTTTFPCPLCAKMLTHAGVEKVIFSEPYPEDEAVNFLDEAGVESELFEGVKGRAYHRLFEPPPYKPKSKKGGD